MMYVYRLPSMLTDVQARRNPTNVIMEHYVGLNRCCCSRKGSRHKLCIYRVRSWTSFSPVRFAWPVYDAKLTLFFFYRMSDDVPREQVLHQIDFTVQVLEAYVRFTFEIKERVTIIS